MTTTYRRYDPRLKNLGVKSCDIDRFARLGFAVDLKVFNRFGGYTALRAKWKRHLEAAQLRPVLLIDEAQEMPTATLNELRLLTRMHFDYQAILTVLLAGDGRLTDHFCSSYLAPLGWI